MVDAFHIRRDLREAHAIHENATSRWHQPGSGAALSKPSWPEIRSGAFVSEHSVEVEAEEHEASALEFRFSENDVARLCARAAARARAEAITEAAQHAEGRIASLASEFGASLIAIERARGQAIERARGHLVILLREIVDAYSSQGPFSGAGEINAFVNQCLSRLDQAGEVRVQVAAEMVEDVREGLVGSGVPAELADNLEIEAASALAPGEVRVVWEDGWADNDPGIIGRVVRESLDLLAAPAEDMSGAANCDPAIPGAEAPEESPAQRTEGNL